MDTFTTIPSSELQALHMDPEHPVPGHGDGMLLAVFPRKAIDAHRRRRGCGSGSPLLSVEVRHLGGALPASSPAHGALATIEASSRCSPSEWR